MTIGANTELRRIMQDPYEFVSRLQIRLKNQRLRTFAPFWQETDLWLRTLITTPRRYAYGLKPRQVAYTTGVAALEFYYALTRPGHRCLQVAHDDDGVTRLHETVQTFHDGLPGPLRPGWRYDSKRRSWLNQTDGGFFRLLAGGKGQGRGWAFSNAHFTEMAFYRSGSSASSKDAAGDAAENVWSSAQSTLHESSRIYVETTGNGPVGLAYKLWQQAQQDPEWEYVFLPWTVCSRYQMAVADPDAFHRSLDVEEQALLEAPHRLTLEQLRWRRDILQTKKWTSQRFRREYPLVDSDPFHLSVVGWFTSESTSRMLGYARHELARDKHTEIRVFHPVGCRCGCKTTAADRFVVGVDTSGGVGGDNAWGAVLRHDGLQVAAWHSNRWGVHKQAEVVSQVGGMFGGEWGRPPLAVVEANNHGRLVLKRLRQMGAAGRDVELYRDPYKADDLYTNRESKREIMTHLRESMEGGHLILEDALAILQMQGVVEKPDGKIEARTDDALEVELKDDGVIAIAMAEWGRRRYAVGEPSQKPPSPVDQLVRERAAVGRVVTARFGGG